MAYDEIERTQQRAHELNLSNRGRLLVSGVEDVSGFDENLVVLTTSMGELSVHGTELHIDRIDLDAGQLELCGSVRELCYDEVSASSSLWHRLFG